MFPYLYSQSRINSINFSKRYSLDNLLSSQNINYSEFRESVKELEKSNLISIFSNTDNGLEETLILRLHSPEDIKELISKKNYLGERIPDFKLTELTYSIDKKNNCDELTFNKKDIKEDKETKLLKFNSKEKKIYWAFYDELYKNFGKGFELSPSIVEVIEKYWESQKISSTKLIELSMLSMRMDLKNEYYLSIIELSNLINEELGISNQEFQIDKYHQFWKDLPITKDKKELKKQFNELFSNYSGVTFYLKLTRKKNVPTKLESWIKECIQKNLDQKIVNGILSFVFSLLKKIPINYLIKMSENLLNDGINTTNQFLSHLKGVLKYEIKNKNRMGVVVEEISK